VLDPFGGESIQVGSFVIGSAVATQVKHAEVIGQDQYDVRWAVLSRGIFQTGYTSQDCGDCKHPWFGDDSRSIHGFDSIESGEQQSGPLRGSGVARVGGWVSIVWGDDLQ
jgi:hypothetical protein